MPFLLRASDHFIIVENKPRQGIFYQLYTKDGYQKPNLIHAFSSDNFAATLDHHAGLHLVTESMKNQILYIHFDKGIASKKVILEDPNHYYMFKHLSLQTLDDHLYLIYSVKHPTGNVRSLMYQPLDPSLVDISVLLQSIPDTSIIKILATPHKLYIVYTDFTSNYQLKLATLTASGIEHTLIHASNLPIIDFNLCLVQDTLHMTYIKDAYGKPQVCYINTQHFNEVILDISHQSTAPSIFNYFDYLWITYPYGAKLFMLLSTDNGQRFSIPVGSSLEGLFNPYQYIGLPSFELNTTTLYALNSPLRLGVIAAMDLKGIHPDLSPASELELLLDGLKLSTYTLPTPPPVPIVPIPLDTSKIMSPLPDPQPIPTPVSAQASDLKSAAKAFMGGMTLFDAEPK